MKSFVILITLVLTASNLYAQDDSRVGLIMGKNQSKTFDEVFNVKSNFTSLYIGVERMYMYQGTAALGYGLKLNKNEVSFSEKRFLGTVVKAAEDVENYTSTIFVTANSYFFESNLFGGVIIGYEFGVSNWNSERVAPNGWDLRAQLGYDIHIGDDYLLVPGFTLGKRFVGKSEDDFDGFDYSLQISIFRKFW